MKAISELTSAPFASRLLGGWILLSLLLFTISAQFVSWNNERTLERLAADRDRVYSGLSAHVSRSIAAVSVSANDTMLRSIIEARDANCVDDCLSANSFRLTERLNDLSAGFAEATSYPDEPLVYVWTKGTAIGRPAQPSFPPALLEALTEEGSGWMRPTPPGATLGTETNPQAAAIYFFAVVSPSAWLIAEVDADAATSFMLGQDGGYDAYLFDASGTLLSNPVYTSLLVEAGVLKDASPILGVSLREPGADLAGPRAGLPLVHAVSKAIESGNGVTIEAYRSYAGQPVIGSWWFDEGLGIGGVIEAPADEASSSNRTAWLLAAGGSAILLVSLWLLAMAFLRRDEDTGRVLDTNRAEVDRLDTLLDEARDEIEDEVSKRKAAFDEYARSEQSLAALLQAFPDGVLVFDGDGKLLMVNRQFRMQWGVAAGESSEKAIFEAMANQLGKQLDDLEDVLLRDEVPPFLTLANGKAMVVESWPASLDSTEGGRFLVFREQSESDADATPVLENMLLEQMNLPVAVTDQSGAILLRSPSFVSFFGGERAAASHIKDVIFPGSTDDVDLLKSDPGELQLEDDATLYRETIGGSLVFGVFPSADLFLEAKHRRKPGMLNPGHLGWHLQKLWCLQILSRSTNHDFNNRISAIYGYSDLAEMSTGDADTIKESVDEIRSASEQGQVLVQSYMGFARNLVGEPVEVPVGEILDAAMQLGFLIKPFSIEVEKDIQHANVELETCENLLVQVFVATLLDMISDLEEVGGKISLRVVDEDGLRVIIEATSKEPFSTLPWRRPEKAFNRSTTASILAFLGGSQSVSNTESGSRIEVVLPERVPSAEVLLLVGAPVWAEPLADNLERNGRAVLAVADVETACSVFENQPNMFSGVIVESSFGEEGRQMFERFAHDLKPGIHVIDSSSHDTATDVLARLL